MTKKYQESKLVATAITEGDLVTLITPNARYEIVDGRVTVHPIKGYREEVASTFESMREKANTGFFNKEYHVRIFGTAPDVNLS